MTTPRTEFNNSLIRHDAVRTSKSVCKNLGFAVALIFSVGTLVAGALAYYKISFFGAIGSVGMQACLYGGSTLILLTLIAKAVDACTERYRRLRTTYPAPSQPQPADPPAWGEPIPPSQNRPIRLEEERPSVSSSDRGESDFIPLLDPVFSSSPQEEGVSTSLLRSQSSPNLLEEERPPVPSSDRSESSIPLPTLDFEEDLLDSLHLSTSRLEEAVSTPQSVPHNNLHPVFKVDMPLPYPRERIKELPKDAQRRLDNPEEFSAFYTESQIVFHESVAGYLSSDSISARQHFEILREERAEAVRTLRERPAEVTIIGGGPSGLVAALEAYLSGAQVHLVEKRVDYSRDTMLRLRTDTAHYLKKRLGDHLYWIAESNEVIKFRNQGFFEREFFGPESFIMVETKVVEWLLAMILYELAKTDDALKIYREWECTDIQQPLDESALVTIQDPFLRTHQIRSDLVIGADSARSTVRQLAGIEWTPRSTSRPSAAVTFTNLWANNVAYEELSSFVPEAYEEGFTRLYKSKPSEELKSAEGNVRLTIRPHIEAFKWEETGDKRFREFIQARLSTATKSAVRNEMKIARAGGRFLHARLAEMGWEKKRLPSNRLFVSTHTIYLGTELPENLLEADRSEILPWIAATLEQNLPRSAINLLMTQVRTCTVFSSQLLRAKQVRKENVFLIGDATGTPDFQTGSGAKKAIDDAIAIGKLIYDFGHSEHFNNDLAAYEAEAKKRTKDLQQKSFDFGFSEPLRV